MLDLSVAKPAQQNSVKDNSEINWAAAYNMALQKLEEEVIFDRQLDACLKTIHQEMSNTLSVVSQTLDNLTENNLGPTTTQQYQALIEIKSRTDKLEQIIDSLNYISRK